MNAEKDYTLEVTKVFQNVFCLRKKTTKKNPECRYVENIPTINRNMKKLRKRYKLDLLKAPESGSKTSPKCPFFQKPEVLDFGAFLILTLSVKYKVNEHFGCLFLKFCCEIS